MTLRDVMSLYFRVSDNGIQCLTEGSSSTKLRELNVSHCSHITDMSVMRIAQRYIDTFTHISHCGLLNSVRQQLFLCHVCTILSGCVNCPISTWAIVRDWLTWVWSGWVAALSALLTSAVATSRIRYCLDVCSYPHTFLKERQKITGPDGEVCNLIFVFFRGWRLLREFAWRT